MCWTWPKSFATNSESKIKKKEDKVMTAIEKKRQEMINEFLSRWFLLGGMISSDTYKRTMGSASKRFAEELAAYNLTLRKGMNEPGAENQLMMAGHEWLLRQWFFRPLKRSDIELAIEWYTQGSAVKAFQTKIFQRLLEEEKGEDIYLPIDVYGFPGGQTFLSKVPVMSFEGVGGIVTLIEPQMCRYYGSIIHATKGRLMYEVAKKDHAEFGYRSDPTEIMAPAKLLSIYIGNGGNQVLTSCDAVEIMFPRQFRSIGTVGHEGTCSLQEFSKGLDVAEEEFMEEFVSNRRGEPASLLPDLIDAETVGLENVMRVTKRHIYNPKIGTRVDSSKTGIQGIAEQTVLYYNRYIKEGLGARPIIFEDEVNPEKVAFVRDYFQKKTGIYPEVYTPFPGAGGYYYRMFHRDTVSAAFKRAKTGKNPNIKFSNAEGKGSTPGAVRVYGDGSEMVIADATEANDFGEPLYVKLVEHGRIINPEDMNFEAQAERGNRTWGKYKSYRLSPLITEWMEKFVKMRSEAQERARIK
jgi:nicotinate phosphoribosyltransferase